MGIIESVPLHSLRQRPERPIGLLRALFQLYFEVSLYQVPETELPESQQAGRQHGIEDSAGDKFMVLSQQSQIIIGAVHDQLVARECLEQ